MNSKDFEYLLFVTRFIREQWKHEFCNDNRLRLAVLLGAGLVFNFVPKLAYLTDKSYKISLNFLTVVIIQSLLTAISLVIFVLLWTALTSILSGAWLYLTRTQQVLSSDRQTLYVILKHPHALVSLLAGLFAAALAGLFYLLSNILLLSLLATHVTRLIVG